MENLGQIVSVRKKLQTAPRRAIIALHRLVFEVEGDRENRKRLRAFTGFDFGDDSEEYRHKLDYASTLTTGDLITICNLLGLDYSGNKEQIRERILRSLMDLNTLNDENDDESDDDNDHPGNQEEEQHSEAPQSDEDDRSSVRSRNSQRQREVNESRSRFAISFKDVEDSVRPFSGDDEYPVERWISDFEDSAIMFQWDNLQKLVFARKSLTGLAKLFVQSETGIKSWTQLRTMLSEEFTTKLSAAQLHKLLEKRTIRKEESLHEYLLIMKGLAARGALDVETLLHYVIEGLEDNPTNKAVLYGATSIKEFKERLSTYEKIRGSQQDHARSFKDKDERPRGGFFAKKTQDRSTKKTQDQSTRRTQVSRDSKTNDIRCFNCGAWGHQSRDCDSRDLGRKCFSCNNFGHTSASCPDSAKGKSVNATVNSINVSEKSNAFKTIKFEHVVANALIDTGSSVSLLHEKVYNKTRCKKLCPSERKFTGFGNGVSVTKGFFQTIVEMDGDEFPITFYVVENDAMEMDAVIGRDILDSADLNFNAKGVSVKRADASIFLSKISLPNEGTEINFESTVNGETRNTVENLINNYQPNKVKSTDIKLKILLKDDTTIYQKPRRLPLPEREAVDNQIREWLEDGIIEPCYSEYASLVVVVKKKDGNSRICIDYRKLNKVIEKNRFPLPIIEDQIDQLKDARIYSSIDLKNGFFHVDVDEESQKYTAFVTYDGQFKFLKAPFGLCNSPPVFQHFINFIFRPLVIKGYVLIYLDDVIVLAENVEEAVTRLRYVLQLASEYGLELTKKKCKFMKSRIEFLGQVIEAGKVYPSPEKVQAVLNYPEPKSVKDVQSFLGLTGYFRKFMQSYSLVAKPLSDLLRKDVDFQFENKERDAFNDLKRILTNDPVLKIFDSKHETELHTDASQDGFGAILLQRSPEDDQLHPTHFSSRKTSPAERNYKSYELEVLAIVGALNKFRVYLLGIPFKIVTDCAAFNQTMNKKEVSAKIWRWAQLLEDFEYVIEHRPGERMKHVDAMSRYPIMQIHEDDITSKLKRAQEKDALLQPMFEAAKEKNGSDYVLRGGILYKYFKGMDLLVVPTAMQEEIILKAHQRGHFAAKRTKDAIKDEYYIPDLRTKVESLIANCVACVVANKKTGKQEGFLHPIPKTDVPLHTYHLDHLGPLDSTAKSYKHILAVIDSFTKFVWLYPTKTTTSKETLSKLDKQKQIFGSPSYIITDRGTTFSSDEFKKYCDDESIHHSMITTGLPRANGQVERLNRTIIPILTKLSLDDPKKWYRHVDKVQQTINSTFQRSINTTPFQLLIGVKMKQKEDLALKSLIEDEFRDQFEQTRCEARLNAKSQILKTQEENKRGYNRRRCEPKKYSVNDLVAIKRTQMLPGRKLRAKYLGPYKVLKVKLNDTYDVIRITPGDGPTKTSTCAEYMKPWPSR